MRKQRQSSLFTALLGLHTDAPSEDDIPEPLDPLEGHAHDEAGHHGADEAADAANAPEVEEDDLLGAAVEVHGVLLVAVVEDAAVGRGGGLWLGHGVRVVVVVHHVVGVAVMAVVVVVVARHDSWKKTQVMPGLSVSRDWRKLNCHSQSQGSISG